MKNDSQQNRRDCKAEIPRRQNPTASAVGAPPIGRPLKRSSSRKLETSSNLSPTRVLSSSPPLHPPATLASPSGPQLPSMLPCFRSRVATLSSTFTPRFAARASYSTTVPRLSENFIPANDPTPPTAKPNVSGTNATPVDAMGGWDAPLREEPEAGERLRHLQAPNRATTWAASQQPKEKAMVGPRFEQTIMELQPQPLAAIELIHRQPVRWTKKRVVSCDGGGGPLGHPKVFINTDKPEIATCGYCGLPFAHEQHRAYLKSLPATSYPLEPTGDAAEVNESQRVTEGGFEQR
ncbi:hypothetical protein AnigIFM56816_002399 [Aspergillus niger]|nr:hypothetical protein AnigIFM56816_002399 [Aspergillus niger]